MKKNASDTAPQEGPLRFAVLATDVALFTVRNGELLVRLVRVDRPPYFVDRTGLPGGLIDPKETADEAARRHLSAKAFIAPQKLHVEQLYTFSDVDRDPRGRVVAIAYLALVPWEALSAVEQSNSSDAWWSTLSKAQKLAYDHDGILKMALVRLRSRVTYTTLISKLMPKEFTLTELEHINEAILKTDLDKRNFRKKILKLKILAPLNRKRASGAFRPAELYRFSSEKISDIEVL